jgi:hypothetical protein
VIVVAGRIGGRVLAAGERADDRRVRCGGLGQHAAMQPGNQRVDEDKRRQGARQRATINTTEKGEKRAPHGRWSTSRQLRPLAAHPRHGAASGGRSTIGGSGSGGMAPPIGAVAARSNSVFSVGGGAGRTWKRDQT